MKVIFNGLEMGHFFSANIKRLHYLYFQNIVGKRDNEFLVKIFDRNNLLREIFSEEIPELNIFTKDDPNVLWVEYEINGVKYKGAGFEILEGSKKIDLLVLKKYINIFAEAEIEIIAKEAEDYYLGNEDENMED